MCSDRGPGVTFFFLWMPLPRTKPHAEAWRAAPRLVAMHPQLTLDNNQMCVDQILAFQRCHEEVGLWGKLTARCNTEKSLLDRRARPCR